MNKNTNNKQKKEGKSPKVDRHDEEDFLSLDAATREGVHKLLDLGYTRIWKNVDALRNNDNDVNRAVMRLESHARKIAFLQAEYPSIQLVRIRQCLKNNGGKVDVVSGILDSQIRRQACVKQLISEGFTQPRKRLREVVIKSEFDLNMARQVLSGRVAEGFPMSESTSSASSSSSDESCSDSSDGEDNKLQLPAAGQGRMRIAVEALISEGFTLSRPTLRETVRQHKFDMKKTRKALKQHVKEQKKVLKQEQKTAVPVQSQVEPPVCQTPKQKQQKLAIQSLKQQKNQAKKAMQQQRMAFKQAKKAMKQAQKKLKNEKANIPKSVDDSGTSEDESPFKQKLATLSGLGFHNMKKNKRILKRKNGDLQKTLKALKRQQRELSQSS